MLDHEEAHKKPRSRHRQQKRYLPMVEMNCCPSQRPKCGEWHERDRNLEYAAAVTGFTISCEIAYPPLRNIGCKRGRERDFLDHQIHDRCCGISLDHPGFATLVIRHAPGTTLGQDAKQHKPRNEAL